MPISISGQMKFVSPKLGISFLFQEKYSVGSATEPQYISVYEAAQKCPFTYTQENNIKYLLMDKNHPNKFVFFFIGQDYFGSGISDRTACEYGKCPQTSDETLEFLQ